MRSFDHAQYGPVFHKTVLRGHMPEICLLVVAAVAARFWIGESPHPVLDYLLITLSIAFALILFPIIGFGDSPTRNISWRTVWLWPAGLAIVQGAGLTAVFALDQQYWPVPGWVVGWFALSAVGLAALRVCRTWLHGRMTKQHAMRDAIAIVGHGALCAGLASRAMHPALRVAAVFDTSGTCTTDTGDTAVHRDLACFVDFVRRKGIAEIWIVLPLSEADGIGEFVHAFRNDLVNIRFVPDLTGVAPFEQRRMTFANMPALDLVASPLSMQARAGKAIFDRVFACLALIGIAPLIAVIAVAVKLSSPGPVLFRQRRMGAYGRIFTIYKFRTMHVHDVEPSGEVRQATRGDPRITRVGALLRRTSLDELPQFLNVLKGDMSVVGPRPHAVEHDIVYQDLVDGYIHRYRVKPGITGWAQVNGLRGETDRVEKMQKRVEHDLYYLNNWSFSMDMRIVAATVLCGFTHRNAY